jgi:ribA/ribD-fused uncharacterized protein
MSIEAFDGEFRWLSNFHPAPVQLEGVSYPSVEHAYQAAKTTPAHRARFRVGTAAQAKKAGRSVPMRPDWDSVKVEVMRSLLQQKFSPGSVLAEKLVATAPRQIVEGNWWGDTFWGVCRGRGQNMLGELLMQQRVALLCAQDADAPAAAATPR